MNLSELQRWLNEMPPIFSALPNDVKGGVVSVPAVLSDLFETLSGERAEIRLGQADANELRWVMATAHLLWHPSFRAQRFLPLALQRVVMQEVPALAAVVPVEQLQDNEERREELIRRVLRALRLALDGESEAQAEDRLKQVDSVEHHRVLAGALAREKRATEVREQLAKKAAEEAAAKVSRE